MIRRPTQDEWEAEERDLRRRMFRTDVGIALSVIALVLSIGSIFLGRAGF